jgi:D-alanyl-D-alanine-carboxypeptidase/D-alanyl-D-alanine-endopeptidase
MRPPKVKAPLDRTTKVGFSAILLFFLLGIASAQDNRDIAGDYAGEIGPDQATLHLRIRFDGALTATLDHLDPSAPWMFTCADLHRDGQVLTFTIPSIQTSFKGTFANGGGELGGTWTQKRGSVFVTFTRQKFVAAAKPSTLDGIWLGTQQISNNASSRIQVVFRSDVSGHEYCTMDALDIYYMDMECANVEFKDKNVSFDVPVAGVHWSGKLQPDGNALVGDAHARVIDGGSTKDILTPVNFARQQALTAEKPRPHTTFDPARSPIGAADLQQVLANDLAGVLKSGELAPGTGEGVSIGVYTHGVTRVFSFGAASPDSIFEIGSITKTFTGLLLSQMAIQRKVHLDEPIRELLPGGAVEKPPGGEITLLDLATQRSGLPAMPDNISVANLDQPYADYRVADLLTYIGKRGVANLTHAPSEFGSLGFGVLGTALGMRAGSSYAQLVKDEITDPLGMADTAATLSSQQQIRFLPGHDQFHGPAQAWNSDALAGAIALRSTAKDMLTYLLANLHPEQLKLNGESASGETLPAALSQSLQLRAEVSPGMQISMGWLYQNETGNYWHNGATAAYSAYAFFNPKGDFAAVVLFNASPGVNGSFVENLGRHIYQRLAGKPAISLTP